MEVSGRSAIIYSSLFKARCPLIQISRLPAVRLAGELLARAISAIFQLVRFPRFAAVLPTAELST